MCQDACLRQAVHYLLDFDAQFSIVLCYLGGVLQVDKLLWQATQFHPHILQLLHWCVEIEVF
jgi:hypothetical protein